MRNQLLSYQRQNYFPNNTSSHFYNKYKYEKNNILNQTYNYNIGQNRPLNRYIFQRKNNLNINAPTIRRNVNITKIKYDPYREYIDKEIHFLDLKMRCDLINHKLNTIKYYIDDDDQYNTKQLNKSNTSFFMNIKKNQYANNNIHNDNNKDFSIEENNINNYSYTNFNQNEFIDIKDLIIENNNISNKLNRMYNKPRNVLDKNNVNKNKREKMNLNNNKKNINEENDFNEYNKYNKYNININNKNNEDNYINQNNKYNTSRNNKNNNIINIKNNKNNNINDNIELINNMNKNQMNKNKNNNNINPHFKNNNNIYRNYNNINNNNVNKVNKNLFDKYHK